ncbi:hypothetical protein EJB05_22494, partial [Eragrostis curvula]
MAWCSRKNLLLPWQSSVGPDPEQTQKLLGLELTKLTHLMAPLETEVSNRTKTYCDFLAAILDDAEAIAVARCMESGLRALQVSHRGRLSTLKTVECQGKSKSFLEHQAQWKKEGNKGYEPSLHSWRFAYELPIPKGKWPTPRQLPKPVLDEQQEEELARRKRLEKFRREEERQRCQRIEEEVQRRRIRFPPGNAPPEKQLRKEVEREDRLARVEERHVRNVQMAVRVINRRYPDIKYELREISAKSTIYEFGLGYCHYNFTVDSPTDGRKFYFAEVDISAECEEHVFQCCTLGPPGTYVSCMGCVKERVQPSKYNSLHLLGNL